MSRGTLVLCVLACLRKFTTSRKEDGNDHNGNAKHTHITHMQPHLQIVSSEIVSSELLADVQHKPGKHTQHTRISR